MESQKYHCPECNNHNTIEVSAALYLGISPNSEPTTGNDVDFSQLEFDGFSNAWCNACDWDGQLRDCEYKYPEPNDDEMNAFIRQLNLQLNRNRMLLAEIFATRYSVKVWSAKNASTRNRLKSNLARLSALQDPSVSVADARDHGINGLWYVWSNGDRIPVIGTPSKRRNGYVLTVEVSQTDHRTVCCSGSVPLFRMPKGDRR